MYAKNSTITLKKSLPTLVRTDQRLVRGNPGDCSDSRYESAMRVTQIFLRDEKVSPADLREYYSDKIVLSYRLAQEFGKSKTKRRMLRKGDSAFIYRVQNGI